MDLWQGKTAVDSAEGRSSPGAPCSEGVRGERSHIPHFGLGLTPGLMVLPLVTARDINERCKLNLPGSNINNI